MTSPETASEEPQDEIRHGWEPPALLRLLPVGFGLGLGVLVTYELWRGFWPPNLFSLFFGVMIFGVWSISGPIMMSGLTRPALLWRVTPGVLELERRSPFLQERLIWRAPEPLRFGVRGVESMEGPSAWLMILRAPDGRVHESESFSRRETAEDLKARMEAMFFGASGL